MTAGAGAAPPKMPTIARGVAIATRARPLGSVGEPSEESDQREANGVGTCLQVFAMRSYYSSHCSWRVDLASPL